MPTSRANALRGVRLPSWLLGSGVIAMAMAVMNVTTYGFTILAARLLGPVEYGALAAVMGLLLVVNVLSLGLQATGARRVSSATEHDATLHAEVMSATYRSALVLGLIALALVPVVTTALSLSTWIIAALIAVTAVPMTVMGGQAGILQGERRWFPLAGIYLGVGVGRVVLGAGMMLLRPTAGGAMLGVMLGALVPVVIGWWALRDRTPAPADLVRPGRWARGGVLRETLHNSHALLAFFALSNVDVIIARTTFDGHSAGLYAGGLILTKAVLFLPQFVVVMAFPSMSREPDARRMHLLSIALVLVIGVLTVAGTALLSAIAVEFVGGSQYAALQGRLWAFAALGTVLALLQLMVYNVVARQHQKTVYVIWAALAVLVACTPLLGSVDRLLVAVICLDSTLFVVLLLASLRRAPRPA
ncbi:MAG: lipopolysaccharide biosynthesis protein [Nocardioidaceae bacterium]